jgi:hypothetical protein
MVVPTGVSDAALRLARSDVDLTSISSAHGRARWPARLGAPRTGACFCRFLHEHFAATLREELTEQRKLNGIPDALRLTFLALNKHVYEHLNPLIGRKGSLASKITASGPGGAWTTRCLWAARPALPST